MSVKINELDPADIQAEIRRIATAEPDYVYAGQANGNCMYTELADGGVRVGSCIVGRALVNLGVEPDALLKHEGERASSVLGFSMWLGLIPPDSVNWIDYVQYAQDHHHPWGAAVADADKMVTA